MAVFHGPFGEKPKEEAPTILNLCFIADLLWSDLQ